MTTEPGPAGPPAAPDCADARLAPLRAAHAAGDHVALRRLLSALPAGLSAELSPECAVELSHLRARVEVDPVQIGILLCCFALLCAVVVTHVL